MSTYSSELIRELQNFQSIPKKNCFERAARGDYILGLIFKIGSSETELTLEQRSQIGPLLSKELPSIKSSINQTYCKFKTGLEPWWLQQRSALEYLIQDYGRIPVNDTEKLRHKFEEINLQASVKALTNIILKWSETRDSDKGYRSDDFKYPGIPETHHWWYLEPSRF